MKLLRFLKRDLASEIQLWIDDDLITAAQGENIALRYGVKPGAADTQSFDYLVLMILGFTFLGVSAIILLSHNWEQIPRAVRVGGLLATMLGVNLYAWHQHRRANDPLATGLFMLGALLYGASIMLVAQIYHLGEHFPDGIFWWALGILPMALLMCSVSLLMLSAVLANTWMIVDSISGVFAIGFIVFIVAMYVFLRFIKPSLWIAFSLAISFVLYVQYATSHLLDVSRFGNAGAENVITGAASLLILFSLSGWLSTRPRASARDYALLLKIWLLRVIAVSLIIFTFAWPWRRLLTSNWDKPQMLMLTISAMCALSVGIWFASRRAGYRGIITPVLGIGLIASSALTVGNDYGTGLLTLEHDPVFHQIAVCLSLLLFCIYLIVHGIRQSTTHFFYTGVGLILVFATTRYFDLIRDYISTSILFVVSALVLMIAARYWQKRQPDNMKTTR